MLWKSFLLYSGVSMQLSQVKIDLDPDDPAKATAESYVTCARYADQWSRRDGRWANRRPPGDRRPYLSTQAERLAGRRRRSREDPNYRLPGFA